MTEVREKELKGMCRHQQGNTMVTRRRKNPTAVLPTAEKTRGREREPPLEQEPTRKNAKETNAEGDRTRRRKGDQHGIASTGGKAKKSERTKRRERRKNGGGGWVELGKDEQKANCGGIQ